MEILFVVIALVAGFAAGFLVCKRMNATVVSMIEMHNSELIQAQEARNREALEAQERRHQDALNLMAEKMKTATAEMLANRQKEFAESSAQNIGQIVNPLRETIDRMKQTMNENSLRQTAISADMKKEMEHLMQHSEAARRSADELARVFKAGSKVQGDWGESILSELLESQGLTCGVHYETQASIRDAMGNVIKTSDGNVLRPDVILHLDKNRDVIIDSKVSLSAFWDYENCDDEVERSRFLKAHVDSIQKHVRELSMKDYSAYVQPPKVCMDYVIMFVPNTGALWTALRAQPDLWRKAMEKNVFVADEQTLYAALRIVNMTWTQIAQAQNHEKVFELANEMIERVGMFMKKYQAIGKALESAQKAYEEADRKLQPSGQSIVTTAGKLIKLGAKQSAKTPAIPLLDE